MQSTPEFSFKKLQAAPQVYFVLIPLYLNKRKQLYFWSQISVIHQAPQQSVETMLLMFNQISIVACYHGNIASGSPPIGFHF